MVISESIATSMRGRLVLSAFAFQAVGAFFGTALGFGILYANPDLGAWRWMYATAIVPAILVVIGRLYITESPHWLVSKGRTEDGEKATHKLLKRNPQYPKDVSLGHLLHKAKPAEGSGTYLGVYGIGIFTPTILAAVIGKESKSHALADTIHNDMLGAKGSALMDTLFVLGIIVAFFMVDRVGRIKLQIVGFIGCAVGLVLAGLSIRPDGTNVMWLLFLGFTLFYFMVNFGPNGMTYLLAGEVGGLVAAFLLGAAVTYFFRIETRGLNLEALDGEDVPTQG